MKKLIALLTFLLLSNAISLQAQINGKRWFAEVSAGGGRSRGSFEMNEFYDPTSSLSVDFGYMLTPYIGIVPVSISHNSARFDKKKYIENYLNCKDEYFKRWMEELGYDEYSITSSNFYKFGKIVDFDAESKLWEVTFTPGFVFFSPEFIGFRIFYQVGMGIYYSRVWINNINIYESEWGRSTSSNKLKERKRDFGIINSGGVEYNLKEIAAFNLKFRYNMIYTGEKNKITKISAPDGLMFYYLNEDGLQFHRFLEEKNTRIIELKGGLKIYF